jgi:hypothetical protein
MPSDKRADIRSAQRWSVPEQPPATRRGRGSWVVRWIGAAKRRAPKPVPVGTGPGAQIIRLSWVDTFGRPVRIAPARLLQFAGALVPLLPL